MPIESADLVYMLSTATGPGSSHAGTVYESNGDFLSSTVVASATLDNLFDDIDGTENADEQVDYQCIFIVNNNDTLTLQNAAAFLQGQVAGGANIAIANDEIGVTDVDDASAQAASIAAPSDVPTGVGVFSSPVDYPDGIPLGDIGPGQCAAIWIQRSATDSAALAGDGVTIRVQGDTSA
jgi:hypothetical protein